MGNPLIGSRTRPLRRRPQPFSVACGPFVGMRDSLDPAAADPSRASLLQNCYPQDGSVVVGRPGFTQMGSGFGNVYVTWMGQYTTLAGGELTVAIAGGEIYTYDWATDTWTKVVTTANLTTAGITLSATGNSAVTFADKLVVVSTGTSDIPFMWDGTSGAGGLTELTACPPLYGPAVVYYGKLFGIMASDRATLVWSDENDPTTGYGTAEQWTLGQTDTGALTALLGTNEALYVFRERSITAVRGAVTEDFQTTGTREGVSETTGTASPFAVTVAEGWAYFLDADGRPHALEIGGGVVPIWHDLRETCKAVRRTFLFEATAIYDPNLRLVRFRVTLDSDLLNTLDLCYTPDTTPPSAVAVFRGYDSVCMGVVKDANGGPVVVHGTKPASTGLAYRHGTPDGDVWDDDGAAIHHVVRAPYLGHDIAHDKHYHRIDATLRAGSTMTDLSVDYETPYGVAQPQSATLTTGLSFWDDAEWDEDNWSSDSIEAPLRVGINAQGRWIRPRIQHEQVGERFGLSLLRVLGVTRSDEPNTP
jgi:hypothetical protein